MRKISVYCLLPLIGTHILKTVIVFFIFVPEAPRTVLEYRRQAILVRWNAGRRKGVQTLSHSSILLQKKKKNLKGVFVCLLLVFFFRFSFSFSTKSLLLFNALQPGFTPIGFLKAANDFHAVKFNGHFFVCVLLNFA